ncbi:ribonuclease H-like domain-containing protein, partial [Chaetomium sp. MPI-CAGE-AT-0009]
QRPGYGTLGKPVHLWANYVALAPEESSLFYRYAIRITRIKEKDDKGQENGDNAAEPTGMKRAAILAHLLGHDRDLTERRDTGTVASDYRDNMVSTTKLENLVYIVEYRGVMSDYRVEKYRVALTEPSDVPNPLRVKELLDYLVSDTPSPAPAIQEAVFAQVINIWLRQFSKFHESTESPTQRVVGSKAYPLADDIAGNTNLSFGFTKSLGRGVSSIRGYFSSIRFGAGKAWVNINVTHGAFFNDVLVSEWIREAGYAGSRQYERLHGVLKGVRVKLEHRYIDDGGEQKPIVKIIRGLATTADGASQVRDHGSFPTGHHPPQFAQGSPPYGAQCSQVSFFDRSKDSYVTVYNHFREMPLTKDELVINLGSSLRPAYYPVSVCRILRGQNYHPKLTDSQTQQMIGFAVLKPHLSADCITKDGFERIGLGKPKASEPSAHAKLLNPADDLATVEGRILAMPSVFYDKTRVNTAGKQGNWNLLKAGNYSRKGKPAVWAFLPVGEVSCPTEPWDGIVEELRALMSRRGFEVSNPQNLPYRLPPQELATPTTNVANRATLENHFKAQQKKGYNLLFVLLPNADAELYNMIKTAADVKAGIHTVCLVESKIKSKKSRKTGFDSQFFDNVLLKANLKQGGVNHTLGFATSQIFSKWGAMVLGLDVTQSLPSARTGDVSPSIIGMVANVDGDLAQWPATIAFQERQNQEIVTGPQSFRTLLEPHLDRYAKRHNGKLPAVLILYRDGVSEGQYDQVARHEYRGIRNVCEAKYGNMNQPVPKISIIIVGKRHHTRFYPTKETEATPNGNPRPGTVVDRSITSQFLWEFYLQAHEAIQGTARPAHYVVVVDEFFRTTFTRPGQNQNMPGPEYRNAADVLEGLTHALSYALGRSTRSVGVCTPARLADKVCDRARCYVAAGMPLERIQIAQG